MRLPEILPRAALDDRVVDVLHRGGPGNPDVLLVDEGLVLR